MHGMLTCVVRCHRTTRSRIFVDNTAHDNPVPITFEHNVSNVSSVKMAKLIYYSLHSVILLDHVISQHLQWRRPTRLTGYHD